MSPAPGEDESALVARVGGVIITQQGWSLPGPRGALVAALGNLRQNRRFQMGAYCGGCGGNRFHVATHLRDQGYDVYAFSAGGTPLDSEHFVNAKAEEYWSLRETFERGAITGLTGEEMQAKLAGIRTGTRRLLEWRLRARRMPRSAGSNRRTAPRRWCWPSRVSCRASRPWR
jgi:hypothetical protein